MIVGIGWTPRKLSRWALALLFALAAGLMFTIGAPPRAHADAGDVINSFKIHYKVESSGVLHVTENIDYHFGSSDRHGIERTLVTREPDPDTGKDIVYEISNFTASSPTDSADFSTSTTGGAFSRNRSVTYQIGDPNSYVSSQDVSYKLTYDVKGAMRTSGSYDELYWDATGNDWSADIKNLQITAEVPGGAQDVACYAGPVQSNTACTSSKKDGQQAVFSQDDLPAGQNVTIGVKIKPGLITNNTPILVHRAGLVSALSSPAVFIPGIIGLIITAGIPFVGRKIAKDRTTDLRYLNLAPGTVPLPGAPVEVGKSDPRMEIPVQFTPPPITVAEAGILVDGQVDIRDTAATLVSLAVNGAIKIEDADGTGYQVRLLDPSRASGPHETAMLTKIFEGRPAGAVTDLSSRGSMTDAHRTLVSQTRSLVQQKQWFTKVPRAAGRALGGGWIGAVVIFGWIFLHSAAGAGSSFSPVLLLLLFPIASLIITTAIVRRTMRRGQRTAQGRAVCDHVDGFKQYLATAEAEQLRFEEGQDIFSRYLPWAIAFDLADRWQKICQQLVDMGRLPDQTPYWYAGPYSTFNAFNIGFLTGSLTTAATPAPSSSGGSGFGGTGFGSGGSAFGGGGGFSGGGGGGGGGGSW
ncbi:hypothetical protein GCM10011575_03270 [Microlunatus endophyticus]|uniref:Plant heme peroxidase family profile domain-containing protein n=1 Tax=Microlunatus endophyticus TaxID=1716077 RepID=A0A917RZU6_9ACTN|nr:DUF2207 domain-containing protein [Microlunatus endophyticus]GGL48654.1 hypothetical protein GCM10011575_03270 [Microlunatus endophyticus]